MKRYNYTITELLTVIAIIAILAAIAIPSVGYARKRARTTACISNQGQTMKTILNAISSQNNIFYSGKDFSALNTNGTIHTDAPWTQALVEKGYIKSMEGFRCPEFYYSADDKVLDADSIKQAYGVVVAGSNNGKFDFRGTKLFMYGTSNPQTEIAPSALAIGGCATTDGKNTSATALLKLGASEEGDGKLTGTHNNDMANVFFYDGHAESVDKNNYNVNKYYPKQTSATAGEAVAIGNVWQDVVK